MHTQMLDLAAAHMQDRQRQARERAARVAARRGRDVLRRAARAR